MTAGQVYALGRKEYGRLGLGEENIEEKSAPTPLPKLNGKKCTSISAGTATSFAVQDNGMLKLCAWFVFSLFQFRASYLARHLLQNLPCEATFKFQDSTSISTDTQ